MIQSIIKASIVLDYIAHSNDSLKLADISAALDINKSTLHGILQSLVYCGLLSQDPDTTFYSLGLKTFELGKIYEKNFSLADVSRPFMKQLNEELSESVHLSIESSCEVLYIDCILSRHTVRASSNIGSTDPLYSTACGKVILAYADGDYVDHYLQHCDFKPITPNTITQADDLTRQFDVIRNQGYALDNEEVEIGHYGVAVPILGVNGTLLGEISVSGPTSRMTEKLPVIIPRTIEVCRELSCALGYQG